MNTIKFSHYYKKMPKSFEGTVIHSVKVQNTKGLTDEFIKYDTETVDGKYYQLPSGMVMIIHLNTNGHMWTTVRSWNPRKEKYYKELVGQEVAILVEEETKPKRRTKKIKK